jgi:hypothetical protein
MIINMASNREFISARSGCGVILYSLISGDIGMPEKIIVGKTLFLSFRISFFLHLSPIPFYLHVFLLFFAIPFFLFLPLLSFSCVNKTSFPCFSGPTVSNTDLHYTETDVLEDILQRPEIVSWYALSMAKSL